MPDIAALAVAETLFFLQHLPRMGLHLAETPFGPFYEELVVVIRRRWTLRIVYRIAGNDLLVEYIDPSWVRRSR